MHDHELAAETTGGVERRLRFVDRLAAVGWMAGGVRVGTTPLAMRVARTNRRVHAARAHAKRGQRRSDLIDVPWIVVIEMRLRGEQLDDVKPVLGDGFKVTPLEAFAVKHVRR